MPAILTLTPEYPYEVRVEYNMRRSQSDKGRAQDRVLSTYPKHYFHIQHENLDASGNAEYDWSILWNFYLSMRGPVERFYFQDPRDMTATDEALGVGDGSGVGQTFQCKKTYSHSYGGTTGIVLNKYYIEAASNVVKVNTVTKTEGVDYTLNDDTGLITFDGFAVPNGHAVTATFNFYYKVHFMDEALAKVEHHYNIARVAFVLEEVFETVV